MIRINSSFENPRFNLVKKTKKVKPIYQSSQINKDNTEYKQQKYSFQDGAIYERSFQEMLEEEIKKR